MLMDILKGFRSAGTPVSSATVMETAGALMEEKHKELLRKFGGHIDISGEWAKKWLCQHGWSKRKATSGKRHPPTDLEAQRKLFAETIMRIVKNETIPPDLQYNVDESGVKIVPVSDWTMEERGANRVEVAGKDDKRQVTATIGVTAVGEKLPIMLTYEGLTKRCEPPTSIRPAGWIFTHSENHWSNSALFSEFVKQIIVPHRDTKIKELGLPPTQKALLILDVWQGHKAAVNGSKPDAKQVIESLKLLGFEVVWIPAGCTDDMQPLDLVVNGTLKAHLKSAFTAWAQSEITRQRNFGVKPANIKLNFDLSVLKPLHVGWIEAAYTKVTKEMICSAFLSAGITPVAQIGSAVQPPVIDIDIGSDAESETDDDDSIGSIAL